MRGHPRGIVPLKWRHLTRLVFSKSYNFLIWFAWNVAKLIAYLKENLLRERPELFVKDGTVRYSSKFASVKFLT